MNTTGTSCTAGIVTHWIARSAALALIGFFLLFLFGESEGTIDLANQPRGVQLMFLGWAVIFLGYAVGWLLPIAGGVLVLAALVGMNAVQWIGHGGVLGPWFYLWGVPGVLYLVAGALKRRPPTCALRPGRVAG